MTTNNHPAKGPVSLDRLHQIIEILSKAAAQSDGGNLGYAMADAVRVIDGAIAAFGAEPVADVVAWNREGEERTCDIRLRRFDLAPGPLFAVAQPAPVVPDEREAFNVWNNDTDCPLAGLTVKQAAWLAWLKRSGTIKSFEPATDEFEVWARSEGLIHDSYGLRTVNTSADVARKAWNACRAAILQGSQPVSNRDELREQVRREHAEWSDATFGDVGPVGLLKHLSKEAMEAAAEPDDLSEWADMQFLLWGAQRRAGISDEQINQAMVEKLAVNKQRKWPEPKDGEPRLHIKSDNQPETERKK